MRSYLRGYRIQLIAILLTPALIVHKHALADINQINSLELIADGSIEPPGDRVNATVILRRDVKDAELEIRAFYIIRNNESQERHIPIGSKNKTTVDNEGKILLTVPLLRNGTVTSHERLETQDNSTSKFFVFKISTTIPYSDLALDQGSYEITYEVRLLADHSLSEVKVTPLARCIITNAVRREMNQIVSEMVTAAITQPVEALVWKNNELQEVTWQTVADSPKVVHKVRAREVNIPGEFRREDVEAANPRYVASKEFIPEPLRTIHFATNRRVINPNGNADSTFGNDSVPAFDKMSYGSCVVSIPLNNHKPGKLEQPGYSWLFGPEDPDPSKHFLIEKLNANLGLKRFLESLSNDDVLVYVHGYNNAFKDAILCAAQLQHDFEFAGKLVVFSWPSAGSKLVSIDGEKREVRLAYQHDEDQALKSYPFLAQVLNDLLSQNASDASSRKVHVLAHSMGNRVLLKALHEMEQKGMMKAPRIDEIMLAAADVDGSTFANCRDQLLNSCQRVTFYYASDDAAISVSRGVHQDRPIGLQALFDAKRMDTICADNLTSVFTGWAHGYVNDSEAMLTDIRLMLANHWAPIDRRPPLGPRIESPILNGCFYWTFQSP